MGRANPQQWLIRVQALPITEFALFTALKAASPEFMPISRAIGPLTRSMDSKCVVEGMRDDCPVEAMAKITGKCSGFAPAITAITAILVTVGLISSFVSIMNTSATTSSGSAQVPVCIFSTRSLVGRIMGLPSVQPFS